MQEAREPRPPNAKKAAETSESDSDSESDDADGAAAAAAAAGVSTAAVAEAAAAASSAVGTLRRLSSESDGGWDAVAAAEAAVAYTALAVAVEAGLRAATAGGAGDFEGRVEELSHAFTAEPLLLCAGCGGTARWLPAGQCVWAAAEAILGTQHGVLQPLYGVRQPVCNGRVTGTVASGNDALRRLFVDRLHVPAVVQLVDLADRLVELGVRA